MESLDVLAAGTVVDAATCDANASHALHTSL
ncbi:hypothetical protein HCH_03059 [Hahella chejuensis KCTC 2396]|uniref:Uncharacterized protein n=1 Tax=Hahella chejuensis (strain KCTC 2396) TaxID=349521 RepID=Q2SHP9_HAHCH|nr:hypothetical protein HCH_03059 [Hahella chejuensis KCTC 2396]